MNNDLRTFSFVQRSNWSAPGFADNREAVHQMIQVAIANHGGAHVNPDQPLKRVQKSKPKQSSDQSQ
jgi:hypothetical protein